MNAYLLFAFELHKARHDDLLRQAEEYRLGRASPSAAGTGRAQKKRARRPADLRLAA